MKRSSDRILTTHAGALPQPEDLQRMHAAQTAGECYDRGAFQNRVRQAVSDVVKKQIACGLANTAASLLHKPLPGKENTPGPTA